MVDFRYHLTSLGAVFIALAVGIILGAGPLQNSIGSVLNSQVQALSDTNTQLKEDVSRYQGIISHHEAAWNDIAPSVVDGTLTGRSIAIVAFPGVPATELTAISDRLSEAGATINMQVTLDSNWTSADQTSYRTTFASQLSSYLTEGDTEPDANTILMSALKQLITQGTATGQNATLRDILTGSEHPMMAITGAADSPAQAIVFVGSGMDNDSDDNKDAAVDSEKAAQIRYDLDTYTDLVTRISKDVPAVVVGRADSDADIAYAVRAAKATSTVDNMDQSKAIGTMNIVMALATELNGSAIQLGVDDGADHILSPRVQSPQEAAPAPAQEQPVQEQPAQEQPAQEQPAS